MVQNTLNLANIVACVAAAAGVVGAGGAASLVSATLSGTALWRNLSRNEQDVAQEMARALDQHLARTHLTDDRKKIVVQLVGAHMPSERVILDHGEDAEKIADAMVRQVKAQVVDPGQTSPQAMTDYEAALVAILTPALTPEDLNEARQQDIHRNVQDTQRDVQALLALVDHSGAALRLAEAGVTEKAILDLARRLAGSIADVEQAWVELQNLVEIHLRLQREGHTPSNHGDFVDDVLGRVADLTAQGDYAGAGDTLEQALAKEEAAHRARKSRLLDSAAEVAMLQGDADAAADQLIARADLDAGGQAGFADLGALWRNYYEKGRDKGTALDLEIAIALARRIHARAVTQNERGAALNHLAISLAILGERESAPARLEEAVAVYRAALEERTRDRVPLDWAATQHNLGTALSALGERERGTARLEAAVRAFRAALEEMHRDHVPLDWAMTQQNLGGALTILGERESDTARMEEAVAAFRAALEETSRDREPFQWATTQANLGNALLRFGERESGTARLEEAVSAYRAALEETPRDRMPLDWAGMQQNLGGALLRLGERECGTTRLDETVAAYRAALEEITRDRVPLKWAMTQQNLGNALTILGERESGTARLEEAVAAFRVALEEWTRDRVPLDWAGTQQSLGTALLGLGERESGTARLEEAFAAYRAALQEWTRERTPLDWAMGQGNLGNVALAFFDKTGQAAHLDKAQAHVQAALEVFTAAGATQYQQMAEEQLAAIAARRDG